MCIKKTTEVEIGSADTEKLTRKETKSEDRSGQQGIQRATL